MCLAISAIPISIIGGIQGFKTSIYLIGLIFFVTFTASLIIAYFISRPLERLTKNIQKISKGELDVQLHLSEIYEINNLTESLNRVLTSLKLAVHKVGVKKGEIFEDAVKTKEAFEKKQNHLFNSIKGWAWETNQDGIYTFVSENITEYLGYKPTEILGNCAFDFMEPEDSKNAKKAFSTFGKKQEPIKNLNTSYIDKNGNKKDVIINAYPYYDEDNKLLGFRGVYNDNSDLKKADEKIKDLNKEVSSLKIKITDLLNKKDKLRNIKPNSPHDESPEIIDKKWLEDESDSILIFDEKANIIDCNDKMVEQLGYSKSKILSFKIYDIDALETPKDIKRKINNCKKRGVITFKTIHKRKDGSAMLVNENLQYLKKKKRFKCIVREDFSMKKYS